MVVVLLGPIPFRLFTFVAFLTMLCFGSHHVKELHLIISLQTCFFQSCQTDPNDFQLPAYAKDVSPSVSDESMEDDFFCVKASGFG